MAGLSSSLFIRTVSKSTLLSEGLLPLTLPRNGVIAGHGTTLPLTESRVQKQATNGLLLFTNGPVYAGNLSWYCDAAVVYENPLNVPSSPTIPFSITPIVSYECVNKKKKNKQLKNKRKRERKSLKERNHDKRAEQLF